MIINNHRSFICGVKGKVLSKKEIEFLKKYKPWGIILFKRNIGSIKQTINLTNSIKKIFNNKCYKEILEVIENSILSKKKISFNKKGLSKNFDHLVRQKKAA